MNELKRSRDTLRTPQETLRSLLQDTTELIQQTSELARNAPRLADSSSPSTPQWLTPTLVTETQLSLTERTEELADIVASAAGKAGHHGPAATRY